MPFVALRSRAGGVIARTGDPIDLAHLLVVWTKLRRDAGLVCTFETRSAASSWLSISPPPMPAWASSTCAAVDDEDVIVLDDETESSAVFAVLRRDGGQLASKDKASLIPRLVNTVNALNGEVAVVRMLASMADAEAWLLKPHVPKWLARPVAVSLAAGGSDKDGADVVSVTRADGVIELSDDDDDKQEKEDAAHVAFRLAAQALPPPPPLKRTILSLASIQDSMLLPVVFQRRSAAGSGVVHVQAGRPLGGASSSAATGVSVLTPPSPPPRASQGSGSSSRPSAAEGSLFRTPLSAPITRAAEPDHPLDTDGRPFKKCRPADALPFHMSRLAKAILQRKKSLFVTGGGGVGKTRLLRQCAIEHRQAHDGNRDGLHIVAPTGVAAAAAGGVTLHSYLRLAAGCFDESIAEDVDAARLYGGMDSMTKRRLAETTLLLLDEVSMVSSRMFTVLIHAVEMAHARVNNTMQWRIIAFGDFYQLPPVRGDEDQYDTRGLYAFKSAHWKRLFRTEQLQLRYVWRQEEKKLIDMLSRLRVGDISTDLADFLQSRAQVYQARVAAGGLFNMGVTRIFPHRERVKAHNLVCLAEMERTTGCARLVYNAIDYPIGVKLTEQQVTTQLDAAVMAPKKLEVCVGARVAACAPITDRKLEVPNGTVGTVVGLKDITPSGPRVKTTNVPVVRFDTARGPCVLTVKPVDMKLQSVSRDGAYASRYQIPLVLAWAVTVHRCQGLSMDAAVLDLASCFVDGMVYVALSRVRSMDGVHVLSFAPSKVRADQRVASFYDNQLDIDDAFAACVETSRR